MEVRLLPSALARHRHGMLRVEVMAAPAAIARELHLHPPAIVPCVCAPACRQAEVSHNYESITVSAVLEA